MGRSDGVVRRGAAVAQRAMRVCKFSYYNQLKNKLPKHTRMEATKRRMERRLEARRNECVSNPVLPRASGRKVNEV
eukprot:6213427-Pleurochrysis_carterae.AAC.4